MVGLGDDSARKGDAVKEEEKKAAPGTKSTSKKIDTTPPPRPIPLLPGSRLIFFVDGQCQGIAFSNLYDFLPLRLDENSARRKAGEKVQSADGRLNVLENFNDDGALGYYPTVSVFGGGVATLNPGPDFEFPPPVDIDAAIASSPNPLPSSSSSLPSSSPSSLPPSTAPFPTPRPLSSRYEEFYAEQASLDALDEAESIITYRTLLATESTKLNNHNGGGKRSKSSKNDSNSSRGVGREREEENAERMRNEMRNELLQLGGLSEISRRGSDSGNATPEVSTPVASYAGEEVRIVEVEVRTREDGDVQMQ